MWRVPELSLAVRLSAPVVVRVGGDPGMGFLAQRLPLDRHDTTEFIAVTR